MTDAGRERLAAKFRRATRERIASITRLLTAVEHDAHADPAAVMEEIARELHTLKGEARLLGFEVAADAAHELESRLGEAGADSVGSRLVSVLFEGLDRIELEVAEPGAPGPDPDPTPEDRGPRAAGAGPPPGSAISHRPPGERSALTRLSDHATEVALATSRWRSIVRELEAFSALLDPGLRVPFGQLVSRVREQAREADTSSAALLEEVQELQMVSLDAGLARYPRAVRELAQEQDKRIHLHIDVGGLRIDRVVLDALHEPLLHVLRNAVDHGCEPPAQRHAAGKAEVAEIRISARAEGSTIIVEVADDGRGIVIETVAAAAERRGIVAPGERIDAATARELLFTPGFSTRSEVTAVSGRGVGLDVVNRRVAQLGGTASLRSTPGAGTCVSLVVPASSIIATAFAFTIGPCQCALPARTVEVITAPDDAAIEKLGDAMALVHDDELIPLRDLGEQTGIARARDEGQILIIEHDGRRCGLSVDRVLGERRLVHRARGGFLSGSRLLRDVGISTDGVMTLLLDPAALIASTTPAEPTPAPDAPRRRRVLITDDSELARDLLARMLRDRGHDVVEAVDGEDALRKIAQREPDLVFTDLEMPVLDGFGLLERIRALPQLAELPCIVLTTRSREEDLRRAAEAGASAYLVKAHFDERALDDVLAQAFGEAR